MAQTGCGEEIAKIADALPYEQLIRTEEITGRFFGCGLRRIFFVNEVQCSWKISTKNLPTALFAELMLGASFSLM